MASGDPQLAVEKNSLKNLLEAIGAEQEKVKKNCEKLNEIIVAINESRRPGEDPLDYARKIDISNKARDLLNIFSEPCLGLDDLKKRNTQIEVTIALLKAKPGEERQQALDAYLQAAYVPLTCPSDEHNKKAGIKMLKLGLALLGFTALIVTCMAFHLWPFVPFLIMILPPIPELIPGGIVAAPADVMTAGIISSVVFGVGGLVYIFRGILKMCEANNAINQVEEINAGNKGKVRTLHAAFFQPDANEAIKTAILSDAQRTALDQK